MIGSQYDTCQNRVNTIDKQESFSKTHIFKTIIQIRVGRHVPHAPQPARIYFQSMLFLNRNIRSLLLSAVALLAMAVATPSCGLINDDLDPCPQGVVLRFVYDYNMEFANAFPSQVDCLTVLVYDEQGNYVTQRTVSNRADLADENWRMTIDLPEGRYRLVAYGGMACDKSSFHFVESPAEGTSLSNLKVALDPSELTSPVGQDLHDLFYGNLDVEVKQGALDYAYYTLPMMKDTNSLRLILQELNGEPVDNRNFEFSIVDDNTLMAWNNAVIPTSPVTYFPWAEGQASTGLLPDGSEVKVAFAELSFPRLVTTNEPRLRVTLRSDGSEVIDIPLINYLALYKSERYADMPVQEFLDRESRWVMIFFLDRHWKWVKTQIVVNDWIVRINNVDLGQ